MPRLAKPLIQAALLAALSSSGGAQASLLYYGISGVTDSGYGAYPGQAYAGLLSFDDAGLAAAGEQRFALNSLSFGFHGRTFTVADASETPYAEFIDGVFLGVNYSVASSEPGFSLVAGAADISEAYFAYTPGAGASGFGSLLYDPNPVPEPAGLALLAVGAAAWRISRR